MQNLLRSKFLAILALLFLHCLGPLVFLSAHAQTNARSSAAYLQEVINLSKNRPDSAYLLLRRINEEAVANKNDSLAGASLQHMGRIFYHFGSFPQAIRFHFQADSIFREKKYQKGLADNLSNMALVFYYNKQEGLALQKNFEALAIYNSTSNVIGQGVSLGQIGHLYEKRKQYDSAFFFQRKALSLLSTVEQGIEIAKIQENIGSIYEDMGSYDSAQYYFRLALEGYRSQKDVIAQITVLNDLGDVFRKTNQTIKGLQYTKQALKLAEETNERYQISSAYRDIAKSYSLLGRSDSAFYFSELSRNALLQIYSDENNRQIAFLQTVFDTELKNDRIKSLESEKKLSQAMIVFAVIVLLLLFVLAALIISRQRLAIRAAKAIAEQDRIVNASRQQLMEADLANKLLQEQALQNELEAKARELTAHTLHLIHKNQTLEEIRISLMKIVEDDRRDQKTQIRQVVQQTNYAINQHKHWDDFSKVFEQVHQAFLDKVRERCKDLSAAEMRLIALLRMNINSADMAALLGISQDSLRVARYRLRKKLHLEQGDNLSSFIQSL